MKGPIKRSKLPFNLGAPKRRRKKAQKFRKKPGSAFRDYRGIEGVLEDAQKGKKK